MNISRKSTRLLGCIALGVFSIATSAAAEKWEKNYDFQYDAAEVSALDLRVRDADVAISGDSNATQVIISVQHRVHASSEEDANHFFEKEEILSELTDKTVSVKNVDSHGSWSFFKGPRKSSTKITITLPEETNTRIVTADGDIVITDLSGELSVRSADGDIKASQLSGDIELSSSDGDLSLSNSQGKLAANTSDGDVSLSSFSGCIQAQTADGDMKIQFAGNPTADSSFKSADGDINLSFKAASSLTIEAHVSDGDINNYLEGSTTLQRSRNYRKIQLGENGVNVILKTTDGEINVRSE